MTSALFVTTVPITLEVFLAPFAEHFRSQGWRVDALANGATENERIAGSFDERFDASWSRNPLAPGNLGGTSRRVREIVGAGGYDLVHVHTPVAAFVTRYALRPQPLGTRPLRIYTAHGFHFYEGGHAAKNLVFRSMEALAAGWTDYLVTINQADFEAARSFGAIAEDRVRLIPGIGVDLDRYAPGEASAAAAEAVRTELGIADDAFVVTMVAEMAPVKRHEHLLEALAQTHAENLVVVFVGEGPLEGPLREKALALGVSDRIRWAGYRRDVPAVLAASDALALVSEREGLPRSVLETLAAGRPVIGTCTRGITDAVGDAGWIVDKHDPAALAAALDHAAASPDEVRVLGERARLRAERYSLDRIISAYEDLYEEALTSHV